MEQRQKQVLALSLSSEGAESNSIDSSEQWAKEQEALFAMFADLELWLLPPAELFKPWVPPQLLACRLAYRCRELQEQQLGLQAGNRTNLQEINRLRQL
eukprot:3260100-Amphidinium_carterae.1